MLLKIDFYKEYGKWYAGGVVDVGDAKPYVTGEIEQAIVDNQRILFDGWQNSFYLVVDNAPELTIDESVAGLFCKRLYRPFELSTYKRGE